MANTRTLTVSVYRYNPELDAKPAMRNYSVDVGEHSDPMLLAVLERIKAEQDPTLSFRRSCREGVCGSDGMNINGANGLACITHVSSLKTDHIVVRPLPGFPIVRDLVVDMGQFYKQYERIEPYLQNDQPQPAAERLQSPEERSKLDGLYECILCACCSTACPSYWWNSEKFLGPAALLQAYRWIIDSRDEATEEEETEVKRGGTGSFVIFEAVLL